MDRIQNHREGGVRNVYDRYKYAEENKKVMETVATRITSLAIGIEEQSNVVPLK
jgi:hypothetical protein